MTISTQQAYQIGKNSTGTVNTNGMAWQDAQRINAAVNAGRQGR